MAKKIKENVRDELIGLLKKCGVDEFYLDTKKRELHLYQKGDFDKFFQKFDAIPQVADAGEYGVPYGAGLVASFEYQNWKISGDVCRD